MNKNTIEIENFHELVSEFNKTADKYEIAEMVILTPNDQELGKVLRSYFQEKVKSITKKNVEKI